MVFINTFLCAAFTVYFEYVSTMEATKASSNVSTMEVTKASSSSDCKFQILNFTSKKAEFDNLMEKGIKMVYFDLGLPYNFSTNKSYFDRRKENGLLRWIWVTNDTIFLLRYIEEIHAMLFNMLEGRIYKHLSIQLDAISEGCNFAYVNDTMSIKRLLCDEFIRDKHGKSDSKLCHRTFEHQHYKVVLYEITAYWLGYDFECFEIPCASDNINCKTILKKAVTNYVLITVLFVFIMYFPLLFYFLPENVSNNNLADRLQNYTQFDTPYSLSRLFINLSAGRLTLRSTPGFSKLIEIATSQEVQILAILSLFYYYIVYMNDNFYQWYIPDAQKYESVYLHSTLVFNSDSQKLTLVIFGYSLLGLVVFVINLQIQLVRHGQNVYYIPYIWSNPRFKNVDVNYIVDDEHTISSASKYSNSLKNRNVIDTKEYCRSKYDIFGREILNRISILFSPHLYLSLFHPLHTDLAAYDCLVKRFSKKLLLIIVVFLNAMFVFITFAFPFVHFLLFTPVFYVVAYKKKRYKKLLFLFSDWILIILGSYVFIRLLFVEALSYLLQTLIFNIFIVIPLHEMSFKFWVVSISVFAYIQMFYESFYAPYKVLLRKCFSLSKPTGSNMISVRTYCLIADILYPLRLQIAILTTKSLFLCVVLVVLIEIVIQGVGGESFTEQYLPALLFIVSPAVAIKLSDSDPTEHIEKYEDMIRKLLKGSKCETQQSVTVDREIRNIPKSCILFLFACAFMFWPLFGLYALLRCCSKSFECKLKENGIEDVEMIGNSQVSIEMKTNIIPDKSIDSNIDNLEKSSTDINHSLDDATKTSLSTIRIEH